MAGGEADQLDLFKLVTLQSSNREVGHIKAEPELKLMLLRHWTLLSSLENSNYTVSKLQIWNEKGRQSLRKFLVDLSISLEQSNQTFAYMSPHIKENLKNNFLQVASKNGMLEPIMHGYVRQFDWQTQVSATDMAHAIQSLLDFPQTALGDFSTSSTNTSENRNPNGRAENG